MHVAEILEDVYFSHLLERTFAVLYEMYQIFILNQSLELKNDLDNVNVYSYYGEKLYGKTKQKKFWLLRNYICKG